MSSPVGPNKPAALGGVPNVSVDVPICAVLLACYAAVAATHMTIYLNNLRKGRRFRPSVIMFGFCMARVTTWSLRIVWACEPTNETVAIVANVLVAAGVILLWFINRIFSTRFLFELNPRLHDHKFFTIAARRVPYILVLCCLPMLITAVVQEIESPTPHNIHIDSILLKVALSIFVVFSFSPVIVFAVAYLAPGRRSKQEVHEIQRRLGTGTTPLKIAVVLIATALLVWELAIRVATILQTFPAAAPPWYYSKASFYVFIPVFELIVLIMYAAARVDRLFYVYGPNETIPASEENELTLRTSDFDMLRPKKDGEAA